MRVRFAGIARRIAPPSLRDWLLPFAESVDVMLTGTDDRSVSQQVALVAFTTRVVSAVIALGSQALLARWMGDHDYGVFVVVWVAAVIVGGLACLGFQVSVIRFIPEYIERRETGLLRGVIASSRAYGLAVSTVLALLGAGGLALFGDVLDNDYVWPFFLAVICLPMLAVGEIQDGISRAFNWAGLALWPTFIYRPLAILAFMWLAMRLGYAADAITAMGASIAATYLITVLQGIAVSRRARRAVPAGPRQYNLRFWVLISLPIFLVEGFFNLLTNVDILIVGALTEPEQAAIYYATVKTLAIVHFVYFAVRAGAANRFSRYHVAGDRDRLESFIRDTLHWTFWPSLLVSLALIAVGYPLLSLFGPSFVEGYPLIFIFVIGLLARASVGPAESLLTMAGEQRICAAVYFAVFFANVALNFLLVPMFGLAGAAMATTTTLILETVALAVVVQSRLGIRCWIGFAFTTGRPAEAR